MIKGLKIELEPYLRTHRQFFYFNRAVQHIGWFASRQIALARKPSSWSAVMAVVMAFLIMVVAAEVVGIFLSKMEWKGATTNSWWVYSLSNHFQEEYDFQQEPRQIRDYTNMYHLTKPPGIAFIDMARFFIGNTFGVTAVYAAETDTPWHATLDSLSYEVINIDPGKAITIDAVLTNTGTRTWQRDGAGFVSINVARPYYHKSEMYHRFWYSNDQPARMTEKAVAPGERGTFHFALQAPETAGTYTEYFVLSSENVAWIQGDEISITMHVGAVTAAEESGTAESADTPSLEEKIVETETGAGALVAEENTAPLVVKENIITEEPTIRVGLYKTEDPIIITADTPFSVTNGDASAVYSFSEGQRAVVTYDPYSKKFFISVSGNSIFSGRIRFVQNTTSTIFTILNYDNYSKWNKGVNDNRFRGNVEIAYGAKSGKPWVINELPMEDYLKGIKETSETSPLEYHKAIAVAARSYALWQLYDGTKHSGNGFTVDAVWDQVYRGANVEELVPKFVQAVEDTEGVVVTYNGEVALTPYFAQSDGRTRGYAEVWFGKKKPWLVSVPDPTNAGLKLWGHGVGMSARGALIQASRLNKTFNEILHYYYTDVGIEQRYKRGVIPVPADTDGSQQSELIQ